MGSIQLAASTARRLFTHLFPTLSIWYRYSFLQLSELGVVEITNLASLWTFIVFIERQHLHFVYDWFSSLPELCIRLKCPVKALQNVNIKSHKIHKFNMTLVERGSSVGRMADSQSREHGFESPLLPFRSLGIFFHFTTPQSTQLYKWVPGYRQWWKCEWIVVAQLLHG